MSSKEYKIVVCKTTDINSGEDFMPPYYKVYSVETWGDQPPATWFEMDFDTLEYAKAYVQEKMMMPTVDKYKKLIEDKSSKHAKMFYNLEGDWVIQYQQGRQKYLVIVEEL